MCNGVGECLSTPFEASTNPYILSYPTFLHTLNTHIHIYINTYHYYINTHLLLYKYRGAGQGGGSGAQKSAQNSRHSSRYCSSRRHRSSSSHSSSSKSTAVTSARTDRAHHRGCRPATVQRPQRHLRHDQAGSAILAHAVGVPRHGSDNLRALHSAAAERLEDAGLLRGGQGGAGEVRGRGRGRGGA
ncbi:hypothetical protein B484DRAFT_286529 [Ochromonadaceae sp. CCMP2298]|nr:hypothetical protein B484DRAFT_286529 [Ochromonadaceae sp. CCMP2298]